MRILVATVLLAVSFVQTALGQHDFRNGYIVSNQGDTISGLINYRELREANACEFKSPEHLSAVVYSPRQILGYGILGDKAYRTRVVSVDGDSAKANFLELIVSGKVSLYRSGPNYWAESGTEIHEVSNKAKTVYVDGRDILKYSNKHIATLNMLMFDCPSLKSRIERIRLTESMLTKLVVDYHKCKGETYMFPKAEKPSFKATLGLSIGNSFSFVNAKVAYEEDAHLRGKYKTSYYPMFGLSADLSSPRISQRLSFHFDALYLRSKYYNYTVLDYITIIRRNYVSFDLHQIKVPFGLRYTIPIGSFHSFVNGGLSLTYHLSTSSSWYQDVEMKNVRYVDVKRDQLREPVELSETQLGYWAGVGLRKSINKTLDGALEFRFEKTDGFIDMPAGYNRIDATIKNFQVVLSVIKK